MFRSRLRTFFKKEKAVVFLAVLAVLGYTVANWIRHARFETYRYDLGQADQVLWKASRLYVPYSTVTKLPSLFWSRHLDLTFYLQVPFYRLWSDVRMYLFLESFIVALGIFPVYLFAQEKLGKPLALAISFSYLFSLGVQQALGYPGHADIRLATFLAFLFYFLFKKNYRLAASLALLCLFTKESAAFYLIFIGLYSIFSLKERRVGVGLIVGSFLFLLLVAGYLSSSACAFWEWYRHLGQGPREVVVFLFSHPLQALRLLIFPSLKIKTVFWLLFSFGFLPLLSPGLLSISLPMFAERFLSNRPELWTVGLHYNILTVPIFAWSAIFGLERLKKILKIDKKIIVILLCCYLVICSLLATRWQKSFLTEFLNPDFYQQPSFLQATGKMIKQIPQHVTLEAQEDLFPHLSHRDKIYALGEGRIVEFIALDVNLFAAQRGGKDKYIRKLLKDSDYGLVFCEEGAVLFVRGKKDKVGLCPKVEEFLDKLDNVRNSY